eukprot:scaffold457367_cov45-Prasinocladus_malaysianus.AAC.1
MSSKQTQPTRQVMEQSTQAAHNTWIRRSLVFILCLVIIIISRLVVHFLISLVIIPGANTTG